MNKIEIINTLKNYNFDPHNYIVISSASMVLQDIKKETKDIDIAVTEEYYNYLLNNYKCTLERINEYNHKVYFIDNIINFGIDYYNKNKTIVEGIPTQTIEDIITLKEYLNRDKDKKDLELIRKKNKLKKL